MSSHNNQESGASENKRSGAGDPTAIAATGAPTKLRHRKVVRFGVSVLRIVCIGYVTILVMLVLMETRLVYPGAYMASRPVVQSEQSGKIIDVDYVSRDGVSLCGRLLVRDNSRNTVLFFHGNGSRASWLNDWIEQLSDSFDATVMAAEYRGFSESDETPHEAGVIDDCLAARDYLCGREGIEPEGLILYGRSLGGGCAVAVAADGGAKTLVLDRTFDRIVDVAASRYPFVPVRFLMRNQYDSVSRISAYRGPLIQLHGPIDRVIPIHHARSLHESADCHPKHWIEVPGLGHNDFLPSLYLQQMAQWIGDLE